VTGTPLRISINGRFLGQPLTGVQRYAREWVGTLDELLVAGDRAVAGVVAEVVVPPGLVEAAPAWRCVALRSAGYGGGHAWEQTVLPWATRGSLLFCPGNAAPLASLLGGQPVVVTLHGLSFLEDPGSYSWRFRGMYRILAETALRGADAVITVSETERRSLLARWPGARDRIHAIANGAAPRSFLQVPRTGPNSDPCQVVRREGGTGYLIFVGSLTEGKNLQGAVDALSLLRSRYDVRLVVVGAVGRGLASGRIRIPESCANRVEFLGQVEDMERLVDLYRRAICLVFPSRYESSGLPPTEAMACGCPVVVTELPALRERCGDAALYCDAEDPRTIAACVLQVIEEEGRAETLRQAGTRRAAELSWEENVRRSLEVMRSVAGERLR